MTKDSPGGSGRRLRHTAVALNRVVIHQEQPATGTQGCKDSPRHGKLVDTKRRELAMTTSLSGERPSERVKST